MNSKITIDVAENNQPIISINYQPSEDVRDKLVKLFLESFDKDNSIAKLEYSQHGEVNQYSTLMPTHSNISIGKKELVRKAFKDFRDKKVTICRLEETIIKNIF